MEQINQHAYQPSNSCNGGELGQDEGTEGRGLEARRARPTRQWSQNSYGRTRFWGRGDAWEVLDGHKTKKIAQDAHDDDEWIDVGKTDAKKKCL
jgi:hypothetical protein